MKSGMRKKPHALDFEKPSLWTPGFISQAAVAKAGGRPQLKGLYQVF